METSTPRQQSNAMMEGIQTQKLAVGADAHHPRPMSTTHHGRCSVHTRTSLPHSSAVRARSTKALHNKNPGYDLWNGVVVSKCGKRSRRGHLACRADGKANTRIQPDPDLIQPSVIVCLPIPMYKSVFAQEPDLLASSFQGKVCCSLSKPLYQDSLAPPSLSRGARAHRREIARCQ